MAKGPKRGICVASTVAEQGRVQCVGRRRSKTHGVGYGSEENADTRRNSYVTSTECLLLLPQAQRRSYGAKLPREEKACRKRDRSLTHSVGVSEASVDGKEKSAVQQELGQVGQLSPEVAAGEKKKEKPVDTGGQVLEQVTVDTESAIEMMKI